METSLPTFQDLMNPVVQALKDLGGSGTIEELNTRAAEIAKIPEEQLEVSHNPDKGSQVDEAWFTGV